MRKKLFQGFMVVALFLAIQSTGFLTKTTHTTTVDRTDVKLADGLIEFARGVFAGEPDEVQNLRKREVSMTDSEGHQEYYFQFLEEDQKRCYREMLDGIRSRTEEFYISMADDAKIDMTYHALLKDHPELFWVHNRETVYKTTYSGMDYCLFDPGYTYTDEEVQEIRQSMENAYAEVLALLPENPTDYQKAQTVYTYIIDTATYRETEHDQNIAGVFWKKEAVCAGYAGAVQYLLERLDVPVIYVEGSAQGSDDGHAWNIITLNGQNYYLDVTNGDQTEFLEGDATQLEEHKTIIYDYLCPFPWEYELSYTASDEFPVPECTASDLNFYVLNQGCFDTYDWQTIYDYCIMRLNNNAAVVRYKFSTQEAFEQAKAEWLDGSSVQEVAKYYMQLHGLGQVQYHYGVLDNLKTIYYMF